MYRLSSLNGVLLLCPLLMLQFKLQSIVPSSIMSSSNCFVCSDSIMMMTTFQLSPLPATLLECPETITKHLQQSSTQHHKVAKKYLNYRSLYGLGCFSEEILFLPESMDDPEPDNAGQTNAIQEPHIVSQEVVNALHRSFRPPNRRCLKSRSKLLLSKTGLPIF